MQVWRRVEVNGRTTLEEITNVSQIASDKPILFVFPGMDVTNGSNSHDQERKGGILRMFAKGNPKAGALSSYANKVLKEGNPDHNVEILAVTYSTPFTPFKAINSNKEKRSHDLEASRFVKDFLKPLQKRDNSQPISFFGISYGSLFAQNIGRSLKRSYAKDSMSNELIREKVKSIYQITAADVSLSGITKGRNFMEGLQFSGLAFSFRNDLIGRAINSTPRGRMVQKAGDYRFTSGDNFYRIFTEVSKSTEMWGAEDKKLVRDIKLLNLIPTRHGTALLMLDKGENGEMFRNAFREIVMRSPEQSREVTRLDVKELLNPCLQEAIAAVKIKEANEKPGFWQKLIKRKSPEQNNEPIGEQRREGYSR